MLQSVLSFFEFIDIPDVTMVNSEDEGKRSFTFSCDERFYINKKIATKNVSISLNVQQIVFQFLNCMQV